MRIPDDGPRGPMEVGKGVVGGHWTCGVRLVWMEGNKKGERREMVK